MQSLEGLGLLISLSRIDQHLDETLHTTGRRRQTRRRQTQPPGDGTAKTGRIEFFSFDGARHERLRRQRLLLGCETELRVEQLRCRAHLTLRLSHAAERPDER